MFRLRITGDLGFEFWQYIPEYKGLYQASTYGRIRSVHKKWDNWNERMLLPDIGKGGYGRVTLTKNKEHKRFLLQRLIAHTFLPNFKKMSGKSHYFSGGMKAN